MEETLQAFREEKDQFFRKSQHSPLTEEQKHDFKGLNYFPENEDLRFELPIARINQETIISVPTSAGDNEPYRRYGEVHFSVNAKAAKLTVFQSPTDSHLFLPFRDTTSGKETYGSGRYVEIEEKNGKILLDFNMAYNPYCAYNERWRCPLTPAENVLSVPIEAGEKNFHA